MPRKEKRIKRPMNAFMLWARDNRPKFIDKHPELHNADISRLLGSTWSKLTKTEEKERYNLLAQQAAEEHRRLHPEYKYKPSRKGQSLQKAAGEVLRNADKYAEYGVAAPVLTKSAKASKKKTSKQKHTRLTIKQLPTLTTADVQRLSYERYQHLSKDFQPSSRDTQNQYRREISSPSNEICETQARSQSHIMEDKRYPLSRPKRKTRACLPNFNCVAAFHDDSSGSEYDPAKDLEDDEDFNLQSFLQM